MPNPPTAIMAGSAVLGGIGGAQGDSSTQTSAPWEPQQEYLKYGFSSAQDALKNAMNMGTYSGPRVAGLNQYQTQGANQVANYTGQYGNNLANSLGQNGLNLMNTGANFGTNAQSLFNQYTNGNATQDIINAAGQYANNPYVDGVIDAAGRDVTRQLNEQTLPGLARAAAGGGNSNNTRAGVEAAIAQRGAADRLTDLSSNIRSQFFSNGLNMAQNQYNQNLQNALNANNSLYNAFNSGMGAASNSQNLAAGNFDAMNAAGGLFQGQQQKEYDAQKAAFDESQQNPLNLIGKYMSIVNGNYGGTSTSESGGGMGGAISGALGGGLAAAGGMGKLKSSGINLGGLLG